MHLYEHGKQLPQLCCSTLRPSSPCFSADGVGVWDLFFPPNLPSIALLIPAPEMKGTSHTGVYNQTSKVVYKGNLSKLP